MDNYKYFDLHIHPSLKPYLSHHIPNERKDCWKKISSWEGKGRSQACLDQLKDGKVGIGVATFITAERPMTASFMLDHLAPVFTVLNDKMLDFPNYANHFDRFLEELNHLKRSETNPNDSEKTFKILNSINDYDENQLNLILAIEGGHNLESFNTTLSENLRQLKRSEDRFLYLTLVHMAQYPLATHAYGMQMLKNNDQFKPAGFGLTPLGEEIIDIAYDESIGPRIFIDIKHMSLVSRVKFYRYRQEKGYDNIPIMATHMAATGISQHPTAIAKLFSQPVIRRGDFVEINYERPRGIGRGLFNKTHFNPWSLNLYDEEIVEILDSGGLIGINLDQRILGSQNVKGEFFSAQELQYILSNYKDPDHHVAMQEGAFSDEEEDTRDLNEIKHLRHLCNNILHFVKIGGERAWQQLCIGSDFDGLINPINYCQNAGEFEKLENGLKEMLPKMMKEDKEHSYDGRDIDKKVEQIMFYNAFNFLQEYFI